jgi:hypothetical protein
LELRPQPVERLGGRHDRRRQTSRQLGLGTLACPTCDAPVLPRPEGMSPGEPISCGFCLHAGPVRDFLSLAEPTRPTRVVVRVRELSPRA